MNDMETNKKKNQASKEKFKKTIDVVEEENEEIDYKWLKKPKLLIDSPRPTQFNVPFVDSSRKNSIRRQNSKASDESLTGK